MWTLLLIWILSYINNEIINKTIILKMDYKGYYIRMVNSLIFYIIKIMI